MSTRPYTSGFCAPANPPDSHERCDDHPRTDGVACACPCHTVSDDIKAGLHFDLDEPTYHAHPTSLSHSGAKVLLKAPALYKWQRDNPVHKDVFDFGRAAHAKVLGAGAETVVVDAEDWRSKGAREAREAARAEGKTPLLAKDAEKVDAMAARLAEHATAKALLTEGEPEVSAFCVDEETGVLRRSRFDWHEKSGILVDYKTTVCAEPQAFARSAATFGYHSQHAWYLDIAADLGLEPRGFVFIAQEKEPPFLVSVVELVEPAVDLGRVRNRRALRIFADCTEADLWPGYAPDAAITPIDLPAWAYREEQE